MALVHNVQGHVGDCLAASPAALTRLAEWVKGGSAAPLGSRLDASALVVRRGDSDVRLKGKGGGRGQEEAPVLSEAGQRGKDRRASGEAG